MRWDGLAKLALDGLMLAVAVVAAVVAWFGIHVVVVTGFLLLDLAARVAWPGLPQVPAWLIADSRWVTGLACGPLVAGAALRFFFPGARARALPWQRVVLVCAHEAAAGAARDELRAHGLHARLVGWSPGAATPGRIAVAVPRREFARAREVVRPRLVVG